MLRGNVVSFILTISSLYLRNFAIAKLSLESEARVVARSLAVESRFESKSIYISIASPH